MFHMFCISVHSITAFTNTLTKLQIHYKKYKIISNTNTLQIQIHYKYKDITYTNTLHLTEEEGWGGLEESAGRLFAAATARSSRLSGSGLALVPPTNATHPNALHSDTSHYILQNCIKFGRNIPYNLALEE